MKYLIVSATSLEIQPLLDYLNADPIGEGEVANFADDQLEISILITGVGMMATAFHLGWVLSSGNYDGIIQAGIAGAFDKDLQLGELVIVNRQQYGDLGATTSNSFEDVFDLKLAHKDLFPFKSGKIYNNKIDLIHNTSIKRVRSISVNRVSGNQQEIELLSSKYNPQIEVMEGIGLHYACKYFEANYVELRTISNYVEVRDKSKWKIKEAVNTLNNFLLEWVQSR